MRASTDRRRVTNVSPVWLKAQCASFSVKRKSSLEVTRKSANRAHTSGVFPFFNVTPRLQASARRRAPSRIQWRKIRMTDDEALEMIKALVERLRAMPTNELLVGLEEASERDKSLLLEVVYSILEKANERSSPLPTTKPVTLWPRDIFLLVCSSID
jgi:hypothetical protein